MPNHYALTNTPRDPKVRIYNEKERKMSESLNEEMINKLIAEKFNSYVKEKDNISINHKILNSLLSNIEKRVNSPKAKERLNSCDTIEKIIYLLSLIHI